MQEELSRQDPKQGEYRRDAARTRNNLGLLLHSLGLQRSRRQPREAQQLFREAQKQYELAIALQEVLRDQHEYVPQYRRNLARSLNNLAVLLYEQHQLAQAEQKYEQVLNLLKELVRDFPKTPAYRQDLALLYNNLGQVKIKAGQLDAAEPLYLAALEQRQQLVRDKGDVADYHHKLASQQINLAELLLKREQLTSAEEHCRQARATLEKLLEKQARRKEYLENLDVARSLLFAALYKHGLAVRKGGSAQLVGYAAPRWRWPLCQPSCCSRPRPLCWRPGLSINSGLCGATTIITSTRQRSTFCWAIMSLPPTARRNYRSCRQRQECMRPRRKS